MKTSISVAIIAAVVVFGLISAYGVYKMTLRSMDNVYIRKEEIKNQAVDGCGKIAISVTAGAFDEQVYALCMQNKGY